MPDPIFADPRLAVLYDAFDDDRRDLDAYIAMVDEFGAERILDIGCGTGSLAVRLVERDLEVIGIDPAEASLEIARRKPDADRVTWHCCAAHRAPAVAADMATMTGNVAQVFLSDDDWQDTLRAIRLALRDGAIFVFETRVTKQRAWEQWTPVQSRRDVEVVGIGLVQGWVEVTTVDLPFVSFRWSYRFADGSVLTSDSTLRFRDLDELQRDLATAGFEIIEVRDAPDRPGLEHVVVARATR